MDLVFLAVAEGGGETLEGVFTAASHNDVLKLLIEIVILLFTARAFGEVAQRMGQSSVVGEILAGIILGPSLLSGIFPFIEEWIVPQTNVQGFLLEDISLLGIIFLLLITGLETDLSLIRRQARSAIGVAIGGLSITLSIGFLIGNLLPDDLLVSPDDRLVFALFLAISMAISAIPVIAKVLMDLNLTRRDVGQTIIAAAMIDDTTGWILLSVVIGMAGGAAVTVGSIAESIGSVVIFLVVSFTAGQWFVGKALLFVQNNIESRDKTLTLIVLLAFCWGIVTHALHLEALLGAFVLGILLSRLPGLDGDVIHQLESIALGIFAPIFFATAGLKVDIITLLEPRLLAMTILITAVAMACKVTGVYLGARYIGQRDHWSSMFLALGLNARGSMGIIVATIGLQVGVLTQETFSMIVVMAVVTSLIAPAALRWTLSHLQQEEQEIERLRREEMNRDNIILNAHRVLLPIRPRDKRIGSNTQVVEARILERLGESTELTITLFSAIDGTTGKNREAFLDQVTAMFQQTEVTKRTINTNGKRPRDVILDEAQKGYDLLVLGATEPSQDPTSLFSPNVDKLIRLAPCPTLVVRGAKIEDDWKPRRVLVPSNGALASRRAAEVGFAIAMDEVIVLHVIESRYIEYITNDTSSWEQRQTVIAEQMVGELCEMGEALGTRALADIRRGDEPTEEILREARDEHVDLIILGTNIRAGSDRLFLGPKVERILSAAPCPVIVVNTD